MKFLNYFRKKKITHEDDVFNVEKFNTWFNNTDNGAVYANPGIFLRTDKLSESQILDYIKNSFNNDTYEFYKNSKKHYLIYAFYTQISYNWRQKLRNL